jgi:hypothetical protein
VGGTTSRSARCEYKTGHEDERDRGPAVGRVSGIAGTSKSTAMEPHEHKEMALNNIKARVRIFRIQGQERGYRVQ